MSQETSATTRKTHAISLLLALVGGWAWAACFSAEARPWLTCVALTPLLFLIDRPRPFLFSWIFGTASWWLATQWVVDTLVNFGNLHIALASGLWLAKCGIFAFESCLLVLVARWALPLGEIHRLWLLPATWVLLEVTRGVWVNGFPWNLAAYGWVGLPGALPLTAWIGSFGLSFLVVAANVALVIAFRARRPSIWIGVWSAVALAAVLAGRFSPPAEDPHAPSFPIRVVQPNSPITYDRATLLANYERLISMSKTACDTPALLVWPESAAWPFGWDDAPRLRRDVEMLNRLGCDVVLSSPRRRQDDLFNSALMVSPPGTRLSDSDGEPAEYSKRRLVPWGEYVPLGDLFPFVQQLARNAGQFTPGTDVGLMPWRDENLAMAICYEVIFPGLVSEQVRAGATVLMTITNDAWYGDSSAPWQHLRAARFRAAENRRPMLRAALTGVSAVIDSHGRVLQQLGVGEEGVLETRISGRKDISPYSRAPWWPAAGSGLLVGFAMIRILRNRRERLQP